MTVMTVMTVVDIPFILRGNKNCNNIITALNNFNELQN